jgi:hypothetical protein
MAKTKRKSRRNPTRYSVLERKGRYYVHDHKEKRFVGEPTRARWPAVKEALRLNGSL